MRESNAQRVIYNFLAGKSYHPAKDNMRLVTPNNEISYNGTRIGYFIEDELDGVWTKYLILPLQDFKNDKAWKRNKLSLAHAANDMGIRVVFKRSFDIGFGPIEDKFYSKTDELIKELITVAKYSQDKDVKTAAVTTTCDCRDVSDDFEHIICYSYNQLIDGEFLHAEKIIADFLRILSSNCVAPTPKRWVSLLEPCEHCLEAVLKAGATQIEFGFPHKAKWNTEGYYNLVDSIYNRDSRLSYNRVNFPIKYNRCKDTHTVILVNNFYKKVTK